MVSCAARNLLDAQVTAESSVENCFPAPTQTVVGLRTTPAREVSGGTSGNAHTLKELTHLQHFVQQI